VPAKNFPVDDPAVTININKYALERLGAAASQLELDRFTIAVEADKVRLLSADAKNPNSHVFEFTIPETEVKRNVEGFARSLRFKLENFNLLLKGDYEVLIGEKWPYAFLTHKELPVSYYIVEDK